MIEKTVFFKRISFQLKIFNLIFLLILFPGHLKVILIFLWWTDYKTGFNPCKPHFLRTILKLLSLNLKKKNYLMLNISFRKYLWFQRVAFILRDIAFEKKQLLICCLLLGLLGIRIFTKTPGYHLELLWVRVKGKTYCIKSKTDGICYLTILYEICIDFLLKA